MMGITNLRNQTGKNKGLAQGRGCFNTRALKGVNCKGPKTASSCMSLGMDLPLPQAAPAVQCRGGLILALLHYSLFCCCPAL